MTDLTSEKDRLKFFFPDGCGLLKTPARIENQYHEKGIVLDAMWDTGAQFSVMSERLADSLGVSPLSCRTDGRRWPDDAERDGLCHRLSGQQ